MESPAPFDGALAEGPAGGHAVWAAAPDKVRLRIGLWPKADAKGTVFLFPGRTEYIEKYGRAAGSFARRGYAMCAIDWRGQGLSDRLTTDPMTGHVFRFDDYQADARTLLAQAQAAGLPRPYYLVGHSMGGCIGLRALIDGYPVEASVFSAPMWGIKMSPPLRPLAWVVSWAAPKVGRGHVYAPGTSAISYADTQPFEGNVLTTDPEMFAYMQRQTGAHPGLQLGGPSLHWLYEALSETRALRAHPAPAVPVLTQVGTSEKVVDIVAVDEVMAKWPGGTLTHVDGAEHELMMERPEIREAFFDAAAALFRRHARVAA